MTDASFSTHFRTPLGSGAPIRVGVIVDGSTTTRAAAGIIRDLLAVEFVRMELVIVDRAAPPRPASRFARFRAEGGILFAAYATLDRRRLGATSDPDDLEDVGPLLTAIPTIVIDGVPGGAAGVPPETLARIQATALDVIVDLGSRQIGGDMASAATHGVWAMRAGDGVRFRGGPAGFWEMVFDSPVSSVELVRLGGRDRPEILLDRATFATDATSLARGRRVAGFGATHLVVRALRLLHGRGWDDLTAHRPLAELDPSSRDPVVRRPTAPDVLRWLVPLAVGRAAARIVRLATRADSVLHWRVAIRVGHATTLIDQPDDLSGFRWLESPAGHFYADPFLAERDGRRWLFVEDYSYARRAAGISCAEVGPAGRLGPFRDVLQSAGHLSYPLVVATEEATLMIPESSADGVVRLYRAESFPGGWVVERDLLPVAAVDPTIWRDGDRWWLATTMVEPRGGAGMLMLYHAPAVAGPWAPHPLNPISQDVRTSRGAGNAFDHDGHRIRPSQDGSRGYGYRLIFNVVTTLTPTDYAERPGPSVTPGRVPGLVGLHTYNRVGDVEVIDGKAARPRRTVA